jgi:hypothetical protein
MASNPGSTNGGTPSSGEPYTFPSFGNFGPPYVATLSLPGLTIGLPVWLFPTPVIPNPPNVSVAPNTLDVNTPPTHQPHVDFSPSSPINLLPFLLLRLVKALKQVARLIRRRRNGKRRRRRARKGPRPQQHQMLALRNQLLLIVLGVLMRSTRLKETIQNPNSLAAFVRVTIF